MARAKQKTNACRLLDRLGLAYQLVDYPVDETDLSAETVAAKIGVPLERVYKTLCLRAPDQSVWLAVVAADQKLDLKAAARAFGCRSLAPVAVKELQGLTGYVRGGVTALACRKDYPVVVDRGLLHHEQVSVSAGKRGLQILIHPRDYVRACSAQCADISLPTTA